MSCSDSGAVFALMPPPAKAHTKAGWNPVSRLGAVWQFFTTHPTQAHYYPFKPLNKKSSIEILAQMIYTLKKKYDT